MIALPISKDDPEAPIKVKNVVRQAWITSLLVTAVSLPVLTVGCGGNATTNSGTGSAASQPLTLSSISPASIAAGSPGTTLTVTGSNFIPGSEITWNGAERATLYVSSTSLQTNLSNSDLVTPATVQVSVTNPQNSGGSVSNALPFSVSGNLTPNPIPVLNSISPASAQAGAAATTITLSGANFVTASSATWNGQTLTSTYQSTTTITAQIPISDLQTAGSAQIAVVNPAPGGGTSGNVSFVINAVGSIGQTVINLAANDLVWDAVNQVIYLSLPSDTGSNGNSIQVLNPVTGALGANVFAGSEPDLLSVSSTSKYLYAGLDGSSNMQRFVLPGLTPDINIALGASSFEGSYVAMDIQASPVSDGTVAVVLGTPGVSPEEEGGVSIYDNAVARANALCGFIESGCSGAGGNLYDSIQWNSTGTEMFALNNEDTGFNFYTIPVTASGFGTVTNYGGLAGGFGDLIHYDATTNLIYTNDGVVINPSTGAKAGEFDASGIAVPDGANGIIFFIGQPESSIGTSTFTIQSFDIIHFTPIGTLTMNNVIGSPTHMIRWGTNGLAFTTTNDLSGLEPNQQPGATYILSGSFVTTKDRVRGATTENVHRTWQRSKTIRARQTTSSSANEQSASKE